MITREFPEKTRQLDRHVIYAWLPVRTNKGWAWLRPVWRNVEERFCMISLPDMNGEADAHGIHFRYEEI